MKTLLSCEFNMDTGCVELRYSDGSMVSINCTAVEDEVANSRFQRSELDWLIYNDPLSYAELILNGDPEEYLRTVTEAPQLEFDSYAKPPEAHPCDAASGGFFTFCQLKQTLRLVALHSILTIVPGASFVNQSEKPVNLLLRIAEKA